MPNFTQQLANARRQALIAGRPLTTSETAGFVEGEASIASERAARLKAAESEEKRLDLENRRLAQERSLALRAERERERERQQQQSQQQASGAMSGAIAGAMAGSYYGPYGTAAGAVIGGVAGWISGGGSHICTAVHSRVLVHDHIMASMRSLLRYCKKHRHALLMYYIDYAGPALVRSMVNYHSSESLDRLYTKINNKMLIPIHNLVQSQQMDRAADMYAKKTYKLIKKYTPSNAKMFKRIMKNG